MVEVKGADRSELKISSEGIGNRPPPPPPKRAKAAQPKPVYADLGGWLQPTNFPRMPEKSTFPHETRQGEWTLGDVPTKNIEFGRERNIQGWKLHVSCHPEDFLILFDVLSPKLWELEIPHKFQRVCDVQAQQLGDAAYQAISPTKNLGDGKSCVVYPDDPSHLKRLAHWMLGLIQEHNAHAHRHMMEMRQKPGFGNYRAGNIIREHPHGVKGDLRLAKYPYMFARYGGFCGSNADTKEVYNPFDGFKEKDARFVTPFNDFAANIPHEIRSML